MSDPAASPAVAGDEAGAVLSGQEGHPLGAAEPIQSEAVTRIGSITKLTDIPEVRAYADRIGARPRSLRKLVVEERTGRYSSDIAVISFDENGEATADAGYEPTAGEAAAIRGVWKNFKWPEYVPRLFTGRDLPRNDPRVPWSMADPANVAVCWDRPRKHILCVEERRARDDGGKDIFIWTSWDDGQWRIAEPPEGLPLFGLDTIGDASTIYLHEGPKAAKAVQAIIADDAKCAAHPWGSDLRGQRLGGVAHIGWLGGAERPRATDLGPLIASGARIIMVCDNDRGGKDAARQISAATKIRMKALFFTDEWPPAFDLADDFPAAMFKERRGQQVYVGPRMRDCLRSATWATDTLIEGRGRPTYVPRREYVEEWLVSVSPPLFFHRDRPSQGYTEAEFNVRARAFSDAEDTARLLRQRPSVIADGITYAPGKVQGVVVEEGRRLINTWQDSPVAPVAGSALPWLRFATHLLPIKAERFHALRWTATLIARPDIRIQWGMIFRSEAQGVGKTTWGDILAALVGFDNVAMPGEDTLAEGKFNSFLARKRLVICNEFYSGHSFRTYNRMKTWITDTKVEVEMKYLAAHTVPAFAHFFLCSNDLVPILIGTKDRRFYIPTLTERKKSRAYWAAFYAWLALDGLGIIRNWATEFIRKHGPYLPGEPAPASVAKDMMIEKGLSDEIRLVRDVAESIAEQGGADPADRIMFTYDDFHAWLRGQEGFGGQKRAKSTLVQKVLREAGLVVRSRNDRTGVDERVKIDGRNRVVVLNFEPAAGERWPDLVRSFRRSMDQVVSGGAY